ncbi:serine/threonine-protein kinase TNNI3K-like [Mya arenaria]|uniref:serine/threonine-protein kinase TNNI3K-like n=1 Tax=Mya arenaria TaxID=6604 RepID=UPI0022E0393C|nr:serine/threonine-protein kinase TNNI3K-like [Mya arenaria]XP_052790329.1 serine/threonine-protein kinase TNNI3K-like [Mya arenaria]XP_052790330.1 serine/threonine-protein kinase TNNI3K-like [Mya arenaria]XP_052790331.1 serine/threonine-protein kinase TNNI3K-like [Mya arenaria]
MGNYKSRPAISCADELKKKISESFSLFRSHISEDLRPVQGPEWSDLQLACSACDSTRVAALLIDDNVHEVTDAGLTLLHIACVSGGSKHLVEVLLQHGVKPGALSKNQFSALHLATYKGDIDCVQALLEGSVDVNQPENSGLTALHIAAMCGHQEIASCLIHNGACVNQGDAVKFTPLHMACNFGHDKVVEVLMRSGADLNVAGSVGDRPLHLACGKGHLRVTQLLIEGIESNKAEVNIKDDEEHTPIHFCCKSGHLVVLHYLLEQKADPHCPNIYGDTPLHLACYNGKTEVVRQLISRTGLGSITKENIFSETPLHCACTSGRSLEMVKFLLDQTGVRINCQGRDGHTAFHSACYHGHLRLVQYLLEKGADINLVATFSDQSGGSEKREEQTALMWAYEQGHDAIVTLVKHHKRPQDESAHGDYSQPGGEGSYVSVPSPIGKLKSMTREKIDVLQLRADLPHQFHILISDIEFNDVIGSGSFGKVYKGRFRGKIVAVKRYKASCFGTKSDVDMFCREVAILSKLNSPYVIQFLGACLDDPSQFAIVTQYVPGGSVYSLLHEQKRLIDLHSKLIIAIDVAKGMNYLHTLPQPIIHRDLNSQNILTDEHGHAIVADFGESQFLRTLEDNMTKQPGNLRWMAPEIFTQCTKYNIKADMFSYSLCLWELLAGELPFAHLKPAAAAAEMAYHQTRPPIAVTFPKPLVSLLQWGWNPNPEDRPEFAEILPILEDCKHSPAVMMLSNPSGYTAVPLSASLPAVIRDHDGDGEGEGGRATPPLVGNVSALKSRYEQELQRNCVDDLRPRLPFPQLDKNGYVSDPLSTLRISIPRPRQHLTSKGSPESGGNSS